MSPVTSDATLRKRSSVVRPLLPLIVWCIGSTLVVVTNWYDRQLAKTILTFDVLVDKQPSSEPLRITLDGRAFKPGSLVRPGTRTLVIEGPRIEPYRKRGSLKLGRNNWGPLQLTRQKGWISIHSDPIANEIRIAHGLFSYAKANALELVHLVPVGDYEVVARYEHSTERRAMVVRRNETNMLAIHPPMGSVKLVSDPPGLTFALNATRLFDIAVTGVTPAEVGELPAGEYALSLRWRDSVKNTSIEIKDRETNEEAVTFSYGTVDIRTEPSGATVFSGYEVIGHTPQALRLKPGKYEFYLSKDGYRPINLSVAIEERKTTTIATNLLDVRFAQAMDAAAQELSSPYGDLGRALARVEEALHIQPENGEASALKAKIVAALANRDAKREESRKAAEAERGRLARETRAREAEATFEQAIASTHDASLFPTYSWSLTNRFDQVRTAVSAVFATKDAPWKSGEQQSLDARTWLVRGEGRTKILSSRRRSCAVEVKEYPKGDVRVYAKFWEYVLADQISFTLTGVSPDSWVPVMPGRYRPSEPEAAAAFMTAVAEEFKRRLGKELGCEIK